MCKPKRHFDFCRLFIIQLKGSKFLANIFLLVNGDQRFAQ